MACSAYPMQYNKTHAKITFNYTGSKKVIVNINIWTFIKLKLTLAINFKQTKKKKILQNVFCFNMI